MNESYPYREYEKLPAWKVLKRGLRDLEKNGDLDVRTDSRYIVGYLAKLLVESGLLVETPAPAAAEATRRTG